MVGNLSRHRRAIIAAALLVMVVGACLAVALPPAGLEAVAEGPPRQWAKLRALSASDDRQRTRIQHSYVPLSAIAFDLQLAVVVGEDVGFFSHGAWDPQAVREALGAWLAGGRLRGASTLTQQLAKNLFLSDERSLWRKVREAGYAHWLEERLGKRRILELYLNVVEMGPGVLGAQAGARHYFGVSAAALDADRAAQLAAAIPSPHKHNPRTRTRAWWVRYRAIRERMQRFGTVHEQLLALSGRPRPSPPTESDEKAPPASEDVAAGLPSPAALPAEASEERTGTATAAAAGDPSGATYPEEHVPPRSPGGEADGEAEQPPTVSPP